MHKKDAPSADHTTSNSMEEMSYTSSDFSVCFATRRLSGKQAIAGLHGISIGSSCGLLRAARSGCFADFPATVNQNSAVSKITGLDRYQTGRLTIRRSNTWFMTAPIFTRMAVS
jgi:hypothetical protein